MSHSKTEIDKLVADLKLPSEVSAWFAKIGLTDLDELSDLTDSQVVELMAIVPDIKKRKFTSALQIHRPVRHPISGLTLLVVAHPSR